MVRKTGLTRPATKSKRFGAALLAALFLLIAYSGIAFAQDVIVQTYFVPVDEDDALASLRSINTASQAQVRSYLSIAIGASGTKIYYDHWENGFLPNFQTEGILGSGSGATTQIWGDGICANGSPPNKNGVLLSAYNGGNCDAAWDTFAGGDVVVPESNIGVSGNSTITEAQRKNAPNDTDFDGGDMIAATEQIAFSRVYWSAGTNTLSAAAYEVYPTSEWGNIYRAPVGQNTSDDGDQFEYTSLSIQASENGTVVTVDHDNDNNSNDLVTCNLNRGESCVVNNISQGATVTSNANHPVQVQMMTGDVGSDYSYSGYTLIPVDAFSNDYWAPVGEVNSTYNVRIFLFNPGTSDISVRCTFENSGDNGNVTVPAGGTATFDVPTATTGERCYTRVGSGNNNYDPNGGNFFAVVTHDLDRTYDWGITMVPPAKLDSQVLIGIGLGRDPTVSQSPNENGSPIWVTPVGNTCLFVDANGDGKMDNITLDDTSRYNVAHRTAAGHGAGIVRNALTNTRFFDTTDRNQTGMQIFSRALVSGACPSFPGVQPGPNFVAAWGEDPGRASAAEPGFDVGVTNPNQRAFSVAKFYQIADGGVTVQPGDTITYTIRLRNTGFGNITNVTFRDIFPDTYLDKTASVIKFTRYNTSNTAVSSFNATSGEKNDFFGATGLAINIPGKLPTGVLAKGEYIDATFAAVVKGTAGQLACDDSIPNTGIVTVDGDKSSTATVSTPCVGQLTIIKKIEGPGNVVAFDFDPSSNLNENNVFSLKPIVDNGSAERVFVNLPVGQTYTAQEVNIPGAWDLTTVNCLSTVPTGFNPTYTPAGTPKTGFSLTLRQDEKVTCTFTNVIKKGSIEVKKLFVPTTDTGKVSLGIDGVGTSLYDSTTDNIGHNQGTGTKVVGFGDYNISEAGYNGLVLGNYKSTYSCVGLNGSGSVFASGTGTSVPTITINGTNDNVVCTFTNQRTSIEVKKVLVPSTDAGRFNLTIDGPSTTYDYTQPNVGDAGTTGERVVAPGQGYVIGETGGTSPVTSLSDYTTTAACVDSANGNAVVNITSPTATGGTVTPTAGQRVVCTITNTIKPGVLQVTKTVTPSFTRTYTWQLFKKATPASINAFDGETFNITYEVTGTRTTANTGHGLSGTITVLNTGPGAATLTTIVDVPSTGGTVVYSPVGCNTPNITLQKNQSHVCNYTVTMTPAQGVSGSNKATATRQGGTQFSSPDMPYNFSTPTTIAGSPTMTVSDVDNINDTTDKSFTAWNSDGNHTSGTYTTTLKCEDLVNDGLNYNQASNLKGSFTISNTATGVFSGGTTNPASLTASKSVVVDCHKLAVTKTITPAYNRTYTWAITKTVDPTTINGEYGVTYTPDYTVVVSRTTAENGFSVSGGISIVNPNLTRAASGTLLDELGGTGIPVTCNAVPVAAGGAINVGANSTLNCTYSQSVPNKNNINNIATVTAYTKAYPSNTATANFATASPTIIGHPTVDVTDTPAWTGVTGPLGTTSGKQTYTYERSVKCGDVAETTPGSGIYKFDNIAKITQTNQTDDASVTITCPKPDVRIRLDGNANNSVNYNHTHTAYVEGRATPAGPWTLLPGGKITVTVTNPSAQNVCNPSATGTCAVTFTKSSAGVSNISARGTGTYLGFPYDVSTGTGGNNGPNATKTWWDLSLAVNPPTDINAVGVAHNFTFKVTKTDGTTTSPVVGASVKYTITADIAPSPSIPLTGNCTPTDGSGECVVSINSDIANHFTINGEVTAAPVAGQPLTRKTSGAFGPSGTGPAQKTYVDLRISVTPQDDTNPVGQAHKFEAFVEEKIGAGPWQPIEVGTVVTWTVTPPPTTLPAATCTTIGTTGKCEVTINSTVPAVYTANAKVSHAHVVGQPLLRDTAANSGPGGSDSAIKTYVDARIKIEQSATNAVDHSHTFTVTVEKNVGAGWVAAASVPVTPTISGVGGLASPDNGTCDTGTDGDGECTIIINSSVAGVTNVSAKSEVSFNHGVKIVVTTNGTAGNSAPVAKTWVDMRIRITPNQDTNPLNAEHIFTAWVEQSSNGTTWTPVNNAAVTWSISSSTTPPTSQSSLTCNTGTGTCTFTINSDHAAVYTVNASATADVVPGQSLTRDTDPSTATSAGPGGSGPATKTYVDSELIVTKTVVPSHTVEYAWNVTKTVDGPKYLFDGETGVFNWSIVATKSEARRFDYKVSGVITVVNNGDLPVTVTEITDTVGTGAPVSIPVATCSTPTGVLAANGGSMTCPYGPISTVAAAALNTAKVEISTGETADGSTPIVWGDPTSKVNDTVDLKDTNGMTQTTSSSIIVPWTYTTGINCTQPEGFTLTGYDANGVATGSLENIVSVYPTGETTPVLDSDDATGYLTCYRPSVSKTATPSLERTYEWTITKSADPVVVDLSQPNTATIEYTVEVSKTGAYVDSNWGVAGTITVVNPNPHAAASVKLSDTIFNGALAAYPNVAVQCSSAPVSGVYTVVNGTPLTCTYKTAVGDPTGMTLENRATITQTFGQVNKTYQGTAPVNFASAVITHTNQNNVDVTDTMTSTLDPDIYDEIRDWQNVEAGDTLTYTVEACSADVYDGSGNIMEYDIDNTAVIDQDPSKNDDAHVDVTCRPYGQLRVVPNLVKAFDVDNQWEVTKTVAPLVQDHFEGENGLVTWTITVNKTPLAPTNHRISGSFQVVNDGPGAISLSALVSKVNTEVGDLGLNCLVNGTTPLSLPVALGATETVDCDIPLTLVSQLAALNTVTATTSSGIFTRTSAIAFGAGDAQFFNATTTLSDTLLGLSIPLSDDFQQDYEVPYTNICADGDWTFDDNDTWDDLVRTGSLTNTAELLFPETFRVVALDTDPHSASATAQVNCWRIAASKTANASWQRDWTWDITKVASTDAVSVTFPTTATIAYTVTVTPSSTSDFLVTGTVSIQNPSPLTATVSSVDLIEMAGDAPNVTFTGCSQAVTNVPGGFEAQVAPQSTLTCTYTATPEEFLIGATNVFTVAQMLDTEETRTYRAEAGIYFSEEPNVETGAPITVTDIMSKSNVFWDDRVTDNIGTDGPTDITYDVVVCGDEDAGEWDDLHYVLNNRATIDETGQFADESVDVQCHKTMSVTATPMCVADAPVLGWNVVAPGFSGNIVKIEFLNATTNAVLYTFNGQPFSGQMLWPESNTDTGLIGGNGIQWPGWTQNPDGTWTDNGSALRPTVKVRFSVNPEQTVTVTYPPSQPTCNTAPPAVVGDRVWYDADHDGIQDAGETGAPGVTVEIYQVGNDAAPFKTTTTDANGIYTFTVTGGYNYYIKFITPYGYVVTDKDQGGNDANDSDGDATGTTAVFGAPAGSVNKTVDEGLEGPTIQVDKVTTGKDPSGVSHTGDGITVDYLKSITWTYTITNNGELPLDIAEVIDSQGVQIECPQTEGALQPGASLVCYGYGTANTLNYSNVVTVTGVVPDSKITVKDTDPSSYVCKGNELYGQWFYDFDGDGQFNPQAGDFLFKDATDSSLVPDALKTLELPVYLSKVGVPEVDGTKIVLSKDGGFQFSDLETDDTTYTLRLGDDSLTPFGFRSTGSSLRFNVKGTDCTSQTHLFGYETDGAVIGDLVWYDVNRNGLQDEWYDANNDGLVTKNNIPEQVDENGYVSIPFGGYEFLDLNNNGLADLEGELNRCGIRSVGPTVELLDKDGNLLDSTLVGNTGYYRFRGFPEVGNEEDTPLAPDGTYGIRLVANDQFLIDGAKEIALTGKCKPLSTAPNAPTLEIIGWDPGAAAAANVTPAGEGEGELVCSTTSDTTLVRNLSNYENGIALDYDYGIQCQPEVREVEDSSLGNFVWHDLNKDGIQDTGEPGLGNITVELYRVDTPSAAGTAPLATTTTNSTGFYSFTGLDAGTYYVQFIIPNGVLISPQDQGASDALDSDIDTTGRTADIVLPIDTDDPDWDAGLYFAPTDDPDDPNGEPGNGTKYWLPIIGAGQ